MEFKPMKQYQRAAKIEISVQCADAFETNIYRAERSAHVLGAIQLWLAAPTEPCTGQVRKVVLASSIAPGSRDSE